MSNSWLELTKQPKIRAVQPTDSVRVTFGAGDDYPYLATGNDGGYYLVGTIVPPDG